MPFPQSLSGAAFDSRSYDANMGTNRPYGSSSNSGYSGYYNATPSTPRRSSGNYGETAADRFMASSYADSLRSHPVAAPPAPAPQATTEAECAQATIARLNQIMGEMQAAGYTNLRISGAGAAAIVQGTLVKDGATVEASVSKAGTIK
jgi:hypothetical protein